MPRKNQGKNVSVRRTRYYVNSLVELNGINRSQIRCSVDVRGRLASDCQCSFRRTISPSKNLLHPLRLGCVGGEEDEDEEEEEGMCTEIQDMDALKR